MRYPRIHFPQLDSTNLEAKRLIESGEAKHGLLITADYQTQGRGQQGKTWHSVEAQNAMLSLVLEPQDLPIKHQFLLNMITSLAVADVIEDYGLAVKVKWPNDIYVSDKKICGILIQNFLKGDSIQQSIIGIGLNVNQTTWPSDVPNPTSLAKELDQGYIIRDVIDQIATSVLKRSNMMTNEHALRDEYLLRLYRRGEVSRFALGSDVIDGTIQDIDDIGTVSYTHLTLPTICSV